VVPDVRALEALSINGEVVPDVRALEALSINGEVVPDVRALEALSINGSRTMGISAVPDVQRAGNVADSNRERCKRCQTSALWKP